jgi:hypothetical protein
MFSKRILPFAAIAILAASAAQSQTVYDSGPPSLLDGFELNQWREADRFVVTESVILTHARFWEINGINGVFIGSFFWEIRANSAVNRPGVLLRKGRSLNLSRQPTGRRAFAQYPEYVNTFDLPSVALPSGTYWMVIHHGPLSNIAPQQIYWETAISTGSEASRADRAPFNEQWGSNGTGSSLAFQLFGAPQSSLPRITAIKRAGLPRISFTTATGRTYRVEYMNSIIQSSWAPLPGAENVAGTGSTVEVSDTTADAHAVTRRFYRVVLQTAPPPPAPPLRAVENSEHNTADFGEAAPNSLRALLSKPAPLSPAD